VGKKLNGIFVKMAIFLRSIFFPPIQHVHHRSDDRDDCGSYCGAFLSPHALQVPNDVIHDQGRAVMKRHALTQHEYPFGWVGGINRPGLEDARCDRRQADWDAYNPS